MICLGRIRKLFRGHFRLSLIWETPNQTLPEGHTWYIIYIYIYVYIYILAFSSLICQNIRIPRLWRRRFYMPSLFAKLLIQMEIILFLLKISFSKREMGNNYYKCILSSYLFTFMELYIYIFIRKSSNINRTYIYIAIYTSPII